MSEFYRQKRVIEMMISSHSCLSERYHYKSLFFEVFLLIFSVILNALVFVDEQFFVEVTMIPPTQQKLIIGISSVLIFAFSLVLILVKWREKAENHHKASEQLCTLLHEFRKINEMEEGVERQAKEEGFKEKYSQLTGLIVRIPDSKFNALKLRHYRKVEISKLIDKHPGSFLFILRIKLLIKSLKEKD